MAINVKGTGGGLYFGTGIDNSGLKSGADQAKGIIKNMASTISSMDVFAGLGVGAGFAFKEIIKGAMETASKFKMAMLEVQTVSDATQANYELMANGIIELSKRIPESAEGLTKAFYQIVSAGYDGAKGMELLEAASKGAVAGVSDTFTVADTMTSIMNAYGTEAGTAAEITDKLFTVIKNGKTNMRELAPSVSNIAGLAHQAGVSFDELMGAFMTGTKTLKTDAFETGFKGFLTGVIKQQESASELAQKMGIDFSVAGIKSKGLSGFMSELFQKTGGNIEQLATFFGNVRGLSGVLAMGGEAGGKLAESMGKVAQSTGMANDAFNIMMGAGKNVEQILENNIAALLHPLGAAVNTMKREFRENLNDLFDSGRIREYVATLGSVVSILKVAATAAAAYYGWVLLLNVQTKIAAAWTAINNAALMGTYLVQILVNNGWKAMIVNIKALNAASKISGIGLLVAGVAAAIALMSHLANKKKELTAIEKLHSEATERGMAAMAKEQTALSLLIAKLQSEKTSREQKLGAITEINSKYGQYLPHLLTEKDYATEIAEAYDLITAAIKKKIEMQVTEDEAATTYQVILQYRKEIDALTALAVKKGKLFRNKVDPATGESMPVLDNNEYTRGIAEKTALMKELLKYYDELIGKIAVMDSGKGGAGKVNPVLVIEDNSEKARRKEMDAELSLRNLMKLEDELWAKNTIKDETQLNDKLYEIEVAHLQGIIDVNRKYGEDTATLETELGIKKVDRKLAENDSFKKSSEELYKSYEEIMAKSAEGDQEIKDRLAEFAEMFEYSYGMNPEKVKTIVEFNDWLNNSYKGQGEFLKNQLAKNLISQAEYDYKVMQLERARAQKIVEIARGLQEVLNSVGISGPSDEEWSAWIGVVEGAASGNYVQIAANLVKFTVATLRMKDFISDAAKGEISEIENSIKRVNAEIKNGSINSAVGEAELGKLYKERLDIARQIAETNNDHNAKRLERGNKGALQIQADNTAALEKAEADYMAWQQRMTGTTAENLADSIISALSSGQDAAADFSRSFGDTMRGAMLKSMKDTFLNPEIKSWYEEFARLQNQEGGLTTEDIKYLQEQWDVIIGKAKVMDEGIDKVLGAGGVTTTAGSAAGLQGAISGVTEDTAGILAGQLGSIRVNVAKNVAILEQGNVYLKEISENTRNNAYLALIYKAMKVDGTLIANQANGNG